LLVKKYIFSLNPTPKFFAGYGLGVDNKICGRITSVRREDMVHLGFVFIPRKVHEPAKSTGILYTSIDIYILNNVCVYRILCVTYARKHARSGLTFGF